ncbi:ABC-type lipoprotein export system ATPase subunit [Marinobacter sp. 3-2]|uniref:ABC transporter ATP-binding protein n=1 Tax=Marinobacter sp. 3-2 TaxID=2485141 RepID=UPI000D38FD53|nr:ATP-binding cassette domain-containing protein [Marinobacter sp. 3-2]ROQ44924.1 ABC-type lipoprotein export system ATPase subunit [Marinobacter sp. 3-2]
MTDLVLKNLCVGTLSNVSLTVPGGQVVCLSGPSGSGKSRLLRAVADLEPHGGTVSVADTCQEDLPAHQWRSRVVMVPADSQWWFDGVGGHFPDHVKADLPSALGFPPEVMEWSVSRLSSGERQRLALWRALLLEPEVLLLDEPTANLDNDSTEAIETWLLEEIRRRQIAVLWVAHDVGQINRVADAHYRIIGTSLERADGSD